jgi:Domain of unknown function (DUF4291)
MNDIRITTLPVQRHLEQCERWPRNGRVILAHHDARSVVVYQAYRPAIGEYAIAHGRLDGPDFSLARMSWIKPNFLWMMYRSGWGTKPGQEVTLGLRLRRAFFERVVREAVPSTFDPARFADRDAWQAAVGRSEVRLQWDPDHAPNGAKLERRAIQLGLRGHTLAAFAHEELLEVIDMRAFVDAQRPHAQHNQDPELRTPEEHPLDLLPDDGRSLQKATNEETR